MKIKSITFAVLFFLVSGAVAPSVMAATSFPKKIADLEKYDNNRERSPILSRKSINYGVIDFRNDVDYRQVRITQNGNLKVFVKTFSGSVRVEMFRGGKSVAVASSQIGKPVTLGTTVSANDVIYIKVVGTNGSQYRLFVQ